MCKATKAPVSFRTAVLHRAKEFKSVNFLTLGDFLDWHWLENTLSGEKVFWSILVPYRYMDEMYRNEFETKVPAQEAKDLNCDVWVVDLPNDWDRDKYGNVWNYQLLVPTNHANEWLDLLDQMLCKDKQGTTH